MGSDLAPTMTPICQSSDFNPRSRMGSDSGSEFFEIVYHISIHAPAWGATRVQTATSVDLLFQSTLPHGERRASEIVVMASVGIFQSTLPHGERHREYPSGRLPRYFNPRSRMGSDRDRLQRNQQSSYFNPRSRMGSDAEFAHGPGAVIRISIHAPAWGAT